MKYNVPDLYSPKFTTKWNKFILYDLANWINGKAFRKKDYSDKGLPIIKIAELNNGLSNNTKYTDIVNKKFYIQKDDILFAWSGNPETSIQTHKYNLDEGYLNQHIFKVKPNNELILDDYFYYLMRYINKNFKEIAKNKQTTGLGHVTKSDLKKISVYIPNKKTQNKISNYLISIDEKININNEIIENLQAQAQAIFKSWFVDFEPFQDGEFTESELGLIPKGWKIKKLKDLSKKIVTGKTPPTKYKYYYGDDTMFITIPDMHDKIFTIETERYLSNLGVNYQPKKTIPAGSICVSCIATVGLVILTSEDSHTNQQINSIIPKDEYYKFFIFNYLRNKKQYLEAIGSSGSTTKNINKGTFSNILIPVPKKEIVIKFHKIVNNKYKLIEKLQYENKKLAQIRDILLPKLMSGQIDLSDIDIGDSQEKE